MVCHRRRPPAGPAPRTPYNRRIHEPDRTVGRKNRRRVEGWQRWHPRWWGTWLLVFVMWLIAWLPWRVQQALGSGLGRLLYRLGGTRREVARANIRACFPQLDAPAQEKLVRDTFVANAKGYIECTVGWWRSARPYARRMIVHGGDTVRETLAQGRGILLLGAHFSILDFALPLVAQVAPIAYMYRPNDNPVLDSVIERRRGAFRDASFTKFQLRQMIDYIRGGGMCWYACDQDMGPRNSVFAPLFGVPAATLTTPGWLARETGARVMFLSQFRHADGVYELRFIDMPEAFPADDEVENARLINAMIEQEIARDPSQYLWLHRRFKTRPKGEPPIYRR